MARQGISGGREAAPTRSLGRDSRAEAPVCRTMDNCEHLLQQGAESSVSAPGIRCQLLRNAPSREARHTVIIIWRLIVCQPYFPRVEWLTISPHPRAAS